MKNHNHKHDHDHCHEHDHEHNHCNCHEHEHEHNHEHGACSIGAHSHDDGCGCGHCHSHDKETSKVSIYLFISSIVIMLISFLPIPSAIKISLYFVSVLLAGYDIFLNGIKELFTFKLEENSLLLIAVAASFVLGEYQEAIIVTILFKLGGFLESIAIRRSKKSMEKLTAIRPDFAYIKNEKGELVEVKAETVNVSDTIYLRAGDKIALDCEIIEGSSSVDSSALTGESVPVYVNEGDTLMSGSINLTGYLKCKVTKSFANSTASQIVNLVYESNKKKGKAEKFISKFAKIYTPIVVISALLLAIVPPLLSLGTWNEYIMRSLIFLVASCPCALVISIPLSFFSSIGAISKLGVLVKGSMYIEKLSKVKTVCLDKTGTLTSGKLEVDEVVGIDGYTKEEVLNITANIESNSTHPIAKAILNYVSEYEKIELTNINETAGLGLTAQYNGSNYICGSKNILIKNHISTNDIKPANIYLCKDGNLIGYITLKEEISKDSISIKNEFEQAGVNRVVMLTGDDKKSAEKIAKQCSIDEYYASLLPKDKVSKVESIKSMDNTVLFIGDGINDAPVLSSADVGVSMGLGSEIANVTSDIILASNKLSDLPKAIKIAKRSMGVIIFNIAFALFIKVAVLLLGSFGFASMWMAVFADVGVTILSVLNSVRIMSFVKK